MAYGLESAAHHLWAREHIAQSNPKAAVRSYRQALRPTHSRHEGGAPLLRFEMAGAQALAGEGDAALATLEGLEKAGLIDPRLPIWARDALADLGL